MWHDILMQFLVPGGAGVSLLAWWLSTRNKGGEKTPVATEAAKDAIDERWQHLFDSVESRLTARIDELEGDLHATQEELAETNAQLAAAQADLQQLQRRERIHIDYHYRLRYQVQGLGHDPAPWPVEIDPTY